MELDVSIKPCCKNPMDTIFTTSHPLRIDFGNDGWPIVNFIQDKLGYKFKDCLDIVHLNYREFLSLINYLQFDVELDDGDKFVGDERWFKFGIMAGCCQNCGVNVFASW